ncbi:hypothetical protein J2848_002626 [Azospirillum lipoferum]|nr:hypothetical protein [Azospirillum lipoferum]
MPRRPNAWLLQNSEKAGPSAVGGPVTDKLKSYAAKRTLMPGDHRQHESINNRAETRTNRPDDASSR